MVKCPYCRNEHHLPYNVFFPSDRKSANLLEIREKRKRVRNIEKLVRKDKDKRERREKDKRERRERKEKDKRHRGKKIYKVFIEFF